MYSLYLLFCLQFYSLKKNPLVLAGLQVSWWKSKIKKYFALTCDKRKWNYDMCDQRFLIISTVYHIGESPSKYHLVWILKQNNLLQQSLNIPVHKSGHTAETWLHRVTTILPDLQLHMLLVQYMALTARTQCC